MAPIRHVHPTYSSDETVEEDNVSTGHEQPKRKRGATWALAIVNQPGGQKLKVRHNSLLQPVGDQAQKLSTFIGTIARDPHKTLLRYFDFRKLPQHYKDGLWNLVKQYFTIDDKLKKWVYAEYAKLFRNWRCDLRAIYKQFDNLQDRLTARPNDIPLDQWQTLMEHFDSDQSQSLSKKNTENRGKQKFIHNTGTKSFARLMDEIVSPGESRPSRAQFWVHTRTSRNVEYHNVKTQTMIDKIKRIVAGRPEGEADPLSRTDVLSQALGRDKYGHVCTCGLGVNAFVALEGMPTRHELLMENATLKEEVKCQNVKIDSLQKEVARIPALEEKIDRLLAIEASIDQLFSLRGESHNFPSQDQWRNVLH